ncbi:hypothetical protein COCMIDRAFT_39425 [Bipolaris oryzae ATCC 44560]|uniref:FAD-binding PCMH-type domain-containing protein n=1 Tax=Bipolaris oryzae ATCC 44560 TaxID=930090 RepID=W6ZG99_COCMI|nr:uncharacterized protein COCMIDRAFT_39425 [Bipolaris oryzae ATCC 44560]EUC42531.1 hypothetical protein COCMIDRAFT_39425 [Bipolaris oryzae ATCC 44560]
MLRFLHRVLRAVLRSIWWKKNKLVLSADNKTLAVGSGNHWKSIYDYLALSNLAVVGGRASTIGVGGLTLGGAITHHTNKYGLACYSVASYEIISASGAIVTVSEQTYPDLYLALCSGGNNFGIITTFNYEIFPQCLMFPSKRQYSATHIPALFDAFGNTVQDAEEYFDPVDVSNPPDILNDYVSIPALNEATKNTTLAEITLGLTESMPAGLRKTMWSQLFKVNTELFSGGGASSIAFQAFTKPALRAMQRKGGNALGLRPDDGPFFRVVLYLAWTDEKDDKTIYKAAQDFLAASTAESQAADPYQPVISGYGADSVARLNKVSSKYDPKGVFQTLQPTSFKLNGEAPFGAVVAI